MHSHPVAELPEDLLNALSAILAAQLGTEALVTYRRLAKTGCRRLPTRATALAEALLRRGFPDPLGRGVWRLDRVGGSGHRRKLYAVLVRTEEVVPR
jgi:hypothetical protein